MKKEKTSLYLLSIVGIVAIVGIVMLILNNRNVAVSSESILVGEDSTGEAFAVSKPSALKLCKVYCSSASSCGASVTCSTLVWKKFVSSVDACDNAIYIAGGGPSITTEPDGVEGAMWNLCGGYGTPYDYVYYYWGSTALGEYS